MKPRPTSTRVGVLGASTPTLDQLLATLAAERIEVSAQATDVASLRDDLDVVILCPTDTETSLLEVGRVAKQAFPGAALIAVCPTRCPIDARRALRAGIDGILLDAEMILTLAPTIRAVRAGLACIPNDTRASIEAESLSGREKQVLGLVVSGYTNAQIADKLYLAESTVKSHLSSAYTKLGVRTRKDATSIILDPAEGLGPGILAIAAA